jgi:lipoprotein-anchoring transpeptidase ErfK/SrfK
MKMTRLTLALIALVAAGCSSQPPRETLPEVQAGTVDAAAGQAGENFVSLPEGETEVTQEATEQPDEEPATQMEAATPIAEQDSRQQYAALSALPEADSRALQFYLGTQTFNYIEDGEVVVAGPIASGKASSPTPTGKYRILSKDKDKESSRYDNEVGTPAWMPYSMQFYGNYFLHEGYLPGQPASHGCIRLGHHHARLLFERMKIGDQVVVSN